MISLFKWFYYETRFCGFKRIKEQNILCLKKEIKYKINYRQLNVSFVLTLNSQSGLLKLNHFFL